MNELTRFLLAVRAVCADAGVPAWTLCQAAALAAGLVCFRPLNPSEWRIFASASFGGLLGAFALAPCLLLPEAVAGGRAWSNLLELRVTAYGALAGFALGAALSASRSGMSPWRLLDRLAPAFGAFVLFGRLGCFVAGCDFGRPTPQGFAVQYPSAAAAHSHHVHSGFIEAGAPMSLPVHPVQLYEALVGALMFALALLLGTRRTPLGLRFSCVACAYAAGRFFTDLLRADLPPLSVIPSVSFTQSQCISLIVLGSAAAVWTGRACDFSATLERR
jgi:phosphatidylglycerol:prolipoprotein diacylglycerol transferase